MQCKVQRNGQLFPPRRECRDHFGAVDFCINTFDRTLPFPNKCFFTPIQQLSQKSWDDENTSHCNCCIPYSCSVLHVLFSMRTSLYAQLLLALITFSATSTTTSSFFGQQECHDNGGLAQFLAQGAATPCVDPNIPLGLGDSTLLA